MAKRRRAVKTGIAKRPAGIIRSAIVGDQPARTLSQLFSNLRAVGRDAFIGAARSGNEGARLRLDRTDGHGTYELFRLERDLYVLTMDCLYDEVREETVAGEGLLELHLCLQGRLTLSGPGHAVPLVVRGPSLLLLHLPVGTDLRERLEPGTRHVGVSVYCRPEFLAGLLSRNGVVGCPVLEELQAHPSRAAWHRILPLTSALHYVASSLLNSPLQGGFRLLHAEAKTLEIICQGLGGAEHESAQTRTVGPALSRRLDTVRQILSTQFVPVPHIRDLARRVGMSESTLKRSFKAYFGITLYEYGLECRMNHALKLLREKDVSIGKIAEEAGYQHQTSFTAAFREHYGFLPRDARVGTAGDPVKH